MKMNFRSLIYNAAKPKEVPTVLKFRAECVDDSLRFLNGVAERAEFPSKLDIQHDENFPDCEVKFETSLTLEDCREIAGSLIDLHVIQETIDHEPVYTGVRQRVDQ